MSIPVLLFTAVVYETTLRVIQFNCCQWLMAEDLAKALGYRTADGVLRAVYRHKGLVSAHTIKGRIDGQGHTVRLLDEVAVRYLCEFCKRPGAFHLMRWLEDGGMSLPLDAEAEKRSAAIVLDEPEVTPAQRSIVPLRLVPAGPNPLEQLQARERLYCRELLRLYLNHCEPEQVEEQRELINSQINYLLDQSYCPTLNTARYELYRKYWLSGGAV